MFCPHNYRNDNNASTPTILKAKSFTAMVMMNVGRPTVMCVFKHDIQSTCVYQDAEVLEMYIQETGTCAECLVNKAASR